MDAIESRRGRVFKIIAGALDYCRNLLQNCSVLKEPGPLEMTGVTRLMLESVWPYYELFLARNGKKYV